MRVYRHIDPPINPPLLFTNENIGALQNIFKNKTCSKESKAEALYFLKDFLPSERNDIWHLQVESFLKLQKAKK